jgi:hypothetical protein
MKILWTEEQRWQAVFDMIEADKARGEHPYTGLISAPGETKPDAQYTSGVLVEINSGNTIASGADSLLCSKNL